MVEEKVHGRTRFNQPAGHLEDGESLLEAAIRECLEETAYSFSPVAFVGLYRWRNTEKNDTYLRATFYGECSGPDTGQALDEGIIAAHWMTLEEIRAHKAELRSPLVLRSLEDYLDGKRYPLDLLVDVD
ncbi:Nudix-like NDP and NTP phosphohydrolase NudJ [hydrothermal vent metagenome]|uniref:Phosphatase NudJ n=1 Tax=hydrothermal vent metagenome TaxID=652676 RepID=A0A3B0Z366_9ZZZZ